MAIQRNKTDGPHAGLDLVIEHFRAAEKRALVTRGIELWTRAEAEWAIAQNAPLPPEKTN